MGAREEARQVRSLSDRLSRKDESFQHLSNELQNSAEARADDAEEYGEQLARRTGDRTEDHVAKAQEKFRNEAHRRLDALHEVEYQFEEQEAADSQTFLGASSSVRVAEFPLVLLVGLFFALWLFLMFFAKRAGRRIEIPRNTLG